MRRKFTGDPLVKDNQDGANLPREGCGVRSLRVAAGRVRADDGVVTEQLLGDRALLVVLGQALGSLIALARACGEPSSSSWQHMVHQSHGQPFAGMDDKGLAPTGLKNGHREDRA